MTEIEEPTDPGRPAPIEDKQAWASSLEQMLGEQEAKRIIRKIDKMARQGYQPEAVKLFGSRLIQHSMRGKQTIKEVDGGIIINPTEDEPAT